MEETKQCETREIDEAYETQFWDGESIPEHATSRCDNTATGKYQVDGAYGDSGEFWLCDDCASDDDELIESTGDAR